MQREATRTSSLALEASAFCHRAVFLSPATPHGPSRRVTFTVSVVIHLDLGASEAGVAVQLTVVQVRLAIAATHGPLVGFTLLQGRRRRGSFTRVLVTPSNTPPGREGCPAARSPLRITPPGGRWRRRSCCAPLPRCRGRSGLPSPSLRIPARLRRRRWRRFSICSWALPERHEGRDTKYIESPSAQLSEIIHVASRPEHGAAGWQGVNDRARQT